MRIRDLSIRVKLLTSYGVLMLLLLGSVLLALHSLSSAHERLHDFVHGINARATVAHHILNAVNARAISARNLLLGEAGAAPGDELQRVKQAHEQVQQHVATLRQMLDRSTTASPQAQALFKAIEDVEARYGPVALNIVQLATSGQREQALVEMNQKCRPLLQQLGEATHAYVAFTEQRSAQLTDEAEASIQKQTQLLVLALVLALAIALCAAWRITSLIGGSVHVSVEAAERISSGDLTGALHAGSADELGQLVSTLGRMQGSLAELVSRVRDSATELTAVSGEIEQGNLSLSQRTEEQASALQQTAAAMEQLNATVRQTADNAASAREWAEEASAIAQQSGQSFEAVNQTMQAIQASSGRIADIIGVIDGIAFQTNLLALNAAVEAARAGEQGRGFAVVATEVRQLANRSAEAAKEIKSLIQESAGHVSHGVELVGAAGGTIERVTLAIQRVSHVMTEISAACREQSDGMSQIDQAVSVMDQTTQQNAALVEEGAAASGGLHQQAKQLLATVSVFRCDPATEALAPVRPAPRLPVAHRQLGRA